MTPHLNSPLKEVHPGYQIDKYVLVEKLGEGTSGVVWKVKKEGQVYAMKIYKPGSEAFLKDEFELMQKLDHPNIVNEYEMGTFNGFAYLIMEYIQGVPMEHADANNYTQEELEQIAQALHYAHAQTPPIIHRDIKPANIFITHQGVKILDFGASKSIHYNAEEHIVAGSYSFMAPTQLLGKTDRQNDVWGFGVTMYLFLTGRHPYYSTNLKDLSHKIMLLDVEPPHHLAPSISPKMAFILMKCLQKNAGERYANFEDIIHDFDNDPTQTLVNKYGPDKRLVKHLLRSALLYQVLGLPLVAAIISIILFGIYTKLTGGMSAWDQRILISLGIFIVGIIILNPILIPTKIKSLLQSPDLMPQINLLLNKEDYDRLMIGLMKNNL